MSRWTEELKNHPIMGTLDNIKTHLSTQFESTDRNRNVEKRRLSKLIGQYVSVLNKISAERAPIRQINDLNAYLMGNVANHTEGYSQSGDAAHLKNANDELTYKLPELGILRSLVGNVDDAEQLAQLNVLADEFTDNIESKIVEFGDKVESFQSDLDTLKTNKEQLDENFETKKKEVDEIARQFQAAFTGSQETRATVAKEQADKLEKNVETQFAGLLTSHKEALEKIVADATKRDEEFKENSSEKLADFISDAEEKHEHIKKLYELVVDETVTAAYLKNADDERVQANLWRWISVGCIGVAALWLLFVTTYPLSQDTTDFAWTWYLSAFSLTTVLLGGAAYAAQQSTKQRMNEKRVRWFYLQVEAFGPFIASLDDEIQKQMKKELAEKLFGNEPQETEPNFLSEHIAAPLAKAVPSPMKTEK